MKPTIAAVLIVKNEATVLPRCLASLGWVDQLVVVDDESSDATREVATAAGAQVYTRRLDRFDTQRNWARAQATCDWILSIDADEVVPAELAAEIQEVIARPDAADVYGIPFVHQMLGRWIWRGGWGDPLTRLFRRHVEWSGAVHEQVRHAASFGTLRYAMLHYSHRNVAEFLRKLDRYTDQEAAARAAEGRAPAGWKMLLSPLRDFLRRYVVLGAWRDGTAGLVLAVLMACYIFVARAKAWELQCPADDPPPASEPRR
ncbi:MAG: glycosyltransferase family 2 protein [Fimbriimonadaceae bacterium]|nr:glycosyltransferase family 2 protein [Fimbriimonadaceae bacterium]